MSAAGSWKDDGPLSPEDWSDSRRRPGGRAPPARCSVVAVVPVVGLPDAELRQPAADDVGDGDEAGEAPAVLAVQCVTVLHVGRDDHGDREDQHHPELAGLHTELGLGEGLADRAPVGALAAGGPVGAGGGGCHGGALPCWWFGPRRCWPGLLLPTGSGTMQIFTGRGRLAANGPR